MAKRSLYGQMNQANIASQLNKFLEEMFKDRAPEHRQATNDMERLIAIADTEQGLNIARKAFNNFDKQNDNWGGFFNSAGDVIGASLTAKQNEFNKYKTALSQAQDYHDSGILGPEKILSWDIDKFEDLSKEVAKLGTINDIIDSGNKRFKYSIAGGQSNEALSRDIKDRFSQINAGIRALAISKSIPEPLVELILMGDSQGVKSMITGERSRIKGLIGKNDSRLNTLRNKLLKVPSSGMVSFDKESESESSMLQMLDKAGFTGSGGTNKYDVEQIKKIIEDISSRNSVLYKEYGKWTGGKFDSSSDLDELNERYKKEGGSSTPSTSSANGKNDNSVNAMGDKNVLDIVKNQSSKRMFESKDDMDKQIFGETSSEITDSILKETTGMNLNELKKDITNKDKGYFRRLLNNPLLKEARKKNRKEFENTVSAVKKAKVDEKNKQTEDYFSQMLWKNMPKDSKSKYKKLSTFKDSFSKEMKRQYDNHVKSTGYPGTYHSWLLDQLKATGAYIPIGIGGALNQ